MYFVLTLFLLFASSCTKTVAQKEEFIKQNKHKTIGVVEEKYNTFVVPPFLKQNDEKPK
ncbi:MAG: hypothetical protein RL208_444 [Pseudomonadota bacterium]|jgi:hypothetical protein